MNKYRGTGVAVVTPFLNNEVDYAALAEIIEHLIASGIDYLIALGSTGEAAALTEEESRGVLDCFISVVDGRLPIVAGNFSDTNTDRLCKKIASYNFEGIDAILSSNPAYVKPTQEGIFQHYMKVAEVSPVPIIMYNVPSRTGSNILWQTVVRVAEASDKVIGIKEATGDMTQTTLIIKHTPDDFFVASGDDPTALSLVACGGDGVISVIANALPKQFSTMITAALNNDLDTARAINMQLYGMHKWLYLEGNPAGIKSAMETQGLCTNDVRLPLTSVSEEIYTALKSELETILG